MVQEITPQFDLPLLMQHSLLKELTEEQVLLLKEHSKIEKFLPNELVIEEGEATTDVYLILEGEASVLKWDEKHCAQVLIGKIRKGDTFGEMSFMDGSPRSTTIKAAKPLQVLKLSKEALASMTDILSHIYANIATININRLRSSNKIYVKSLQDSQATFQIRQHIGKFLIYAYLILGLVMSLTMIFSPESPIYLPWILAIIPIGILIRSQNLPFSHFGIQFQNWASTITISLIAAALIVGLVLLLNLFFPLFPSLLSLPKNILPLTIWPFYIAYCFSQEFIARGTLQTALQDFLQDEKGNRTLLINAAFLFVLLLPFGLETAFLLSLLSLPFGFLYLKQKNIWGVSILHSLLFCLGILKI